MVTFSLKSCCMLIAWTSRSCFRPHPVCFLSFLLFFFPQYYFPFWRWLHFLCSYYIQGETPGIHKGRYFPSNPISKWLLIVLLVGQRAWKGRTAILDSFKVLKTVNKVLSQPWTLCRGLRTFAEAMLKIAVNQVYKSSCRGGVLNAQD